jgi:hypothetical protein
MEIRDAKEQLQDTGPYGLTVSFQVAYPGAREHSFSRLYKEKKVPTAVVNLKVPQRSAHVTMQ